GADGAQDTARLPLRGEAERRDDAPELARSRALPRFPRRARALEARRQVRRAARPVPVGLPPHRRDPPSPRGAAAPAARRAAARRVPPRLAAHAPARTLAARATHGLL